METTLENISSDIFQCGRCKVAFTSLTMFFHHKREQCSQLSWSIIDEKLIPEAPVASFVTGDHEQTPVETCTTQYITPETYGDRYLSRSPSRHCAASRSEDHAAAPKQTEPLDISCMLCNRTFKRLTNLSVHLRTHTGDKPFQCPVCGRCFSQNTHLQRHVQSHRVWQDALGNTVPASVDTTSTHYSCSYCDLVLPDYSKFRIHLKTHTAEKKFKCIQGDCTKLFDDLELLLQHVPVAHPQQTYLCHLCDEVCNSLEIVSSHQQNHSQKKGKTKKKFNCVHCDASFGKLDKLTFHAASHSHQRACTKCSKTFSSEKRLRSHLRIHDDVKPFQCGVCGASFRLKKYLTTHMMRHGERSYVCSHCNTKFKRKDLLDRHVRVHQSHKLTDCPFKEQLGCNLRFSRKDKLKLHLKSHVKKLVSERKVTSEKKNKEKNSLNCSR